MAGTHDGRSEADAEATTHSAERASHVGAAPVVTTAPGSSSPARPARKWSLWLAVAVGLAIGAYFLIPWLKLVFTTVSTDDAYVNSHVTFVAARVPGQVAAVLVDDNYRVKKGDLLVQLDKEPYQVQLEIKQAAVAKAE